MFVSGKQRSLEIRANIRIAFKMFEQRVASFVNVICKANKKKMQSVEKLRYEFSFAVLHSTYFPLLISGM